MSNPLSSEAQLLWTWHIDTINKRSLGTLRAQRASYCSNNNIRESALSLPKDIDCPYLFLRRCNPTRAIASSFMRFLDHTKRRTTVGRTSLDEWSPRRRDLYLTTHNRHPCSWWNSNPISSRQAAADLGFTKRGHWDRHLLCISMLNNNKNIILPASVLRIYVTWQDTNVKLPEDDMEMSKHVGI